MKPFLRDISIVFGAVCVGGLIMYGIIHFQKLHNQASGVPSPGQTEVATVIGKVGKLIELPSGEIPTVATVSDIAKLKNQPFFAHAKNGDKVLIYAQAKKAILFRPSENKLIEVSQLNIQSKPSPSPQANAAVTTTPTVLPSPVVIKTKQTQVPATSPAQ